MKIIRFNFLDTIHYGVVDNEDQISLIEGHPFGELKIGKQLAKLSDVKLLCPCEPKIIVGIGKNYRADAKESDNKSAADNPPVFFKPISCAIGHLESILYPKISTHVNCGGELAVVMKSEASHVTEQEALRYVLGYTCANDVEAVDIFKRETVPTRSKSFFTFCPLGPWIVTDLEGDNLNLKARINGVLMQDASTREMIFDIRRIIASITEFMTLQPGDVILTGSSKPLIDNTLHPGDVVEVEIEKIGVLRNRVA